MPFDYYRTSAIVIFSMYVCVHWRRPKSQQSLPIAPISPRSTFTFYIVFLGNVHLEESYGGRKLHADQEPRRRIHKRLQNHSVVVIIHCLWRPGSRTFSSWKRCFFFRIIAKPQCSMSRTIYRSAVDQTRLQYKNKLTYTKWFY